MNIDLGYIYKLLSTNDLLSLGKINRDWLVISYYPIYDFIVQCLQNPEMRRMPKWETVQAKFNIPYDGTTEEINFFIGEMRRRKARVTLEASTRDDFLPKLIGEGDSDPLAAAAEMMHTCASVRRIYKPESRADSLNFMTETQRQWDLYLKCEEMRGMMGISFPFEPLNICTSGLVPGELTAMLARPGVGKTWFLLLAAKKVIESGKSVLFVSQETAPLRLAMRLTSLMADVSPLDMRRGSLQEEDKHKVMEHYENMKLRTKSGQFFNIIGTKEIKDLTDLEIQLSYVRDKIDVLIWDSPYLVIRKEKWEMRADFVARLKELAEDYEIPILVSWQMNRTFVKEGRSKNHSLDASGKVAYTDAIATDSDNVFVMIKEESEEGWTNMEFTSLKTRDGVALERMNLLWNILGREFKVISYNIPDVSRYEMQYQGEIGDVK